MNTALPTPRSETIDADAPAERRGKARKARDGARRGPWGASRAFVGRFAPRSIVGRVALLNALAIGCLIGVAPISWSRTETGFGQTAVTN